MILELRGIDRDRRRLVFRFRADRDYTTVYEYEDVEPGDHPRLWFHLAAFEANKLCALRPDAIDWGEWARFATPAFESVWRTVLRKVWAQWRYEHDLPDWRGPAFATTDSPAQPMARRGDGILAFCGGGKDSLIAMTLLGRFASLAYSHSSYGAHEPQHRLLDGLLEHAQPARRHRLRIDDDFRGLTAETPSSIFAALPIVLGHGYRAIALGHERSANTGSFVWAGEDINHQWGKSLEAERLLAGYIRQHLVDIEVFGVLQPVHDAVIFEALSRHREAVLATHSCNVEKPWCRRCAKCAYVYLGYAAVLPDALVRRIFGQDLLLTIPEVYRQLLTERPFECVGAVDEARLFYEVCRRRGLGAPMADLPPFDARAAIEKYTAVSDDHDLPPSIAARALPMLREHAARARARLEAALA